MEFPLSVDKHLQHPPERICAWCKADKVCEPFSMAVLSAGAVLMNRRTGSGVIDHRLDGFLTLTWHGAHSEVNDHSEHKNLYITVEIANKVEGGQFDVNFCSTECLRAFLNYAVDQLEEKRKTAGGG